MPAKKIIQPQKHSQQNQAPGLGQTLKEGAVMGMGVGLGSSVGHAVFDGMFGGSNKNEIPNNSNPEVNSSINNGFTNTNNLENNNISCENFMKIHRECLNNINDNNYCNFI